MKNPILFFLCFIIGSSSLLAQIQDSGNHGLMTLTLKKKDLSEIKGTPYFEENFKNGTLFLKGKEPLTAFMRYDVQNEIIEIKPDLNSTDIFVLPPGKNAEYIIGDNTFLIDKIRINGKEIYGYFIEHYRGDNFRFLEKPMVTISEAVAATSGYDKDRPAEIKIKSEYYIQKEDGQIINVSLKQKDIKKYFNSKTAKEYLSKNKIKSIDDLIGFVKHLDQK